MKIPINILKLFKLFKTPGTLEPNTPLVLEKEIIPSGCDPSRSKLAICKPGRKSKDRFVKVYYRKTKRKLNNSGEQNGLVEKTKY